MSQAKRDKLKRRMEAADAELGALVELGIPDLEALDKALDRSLKATNEFLAYPRRVDWGADPNGGVLA